MMFRVLPEVGDSTTLQDLPNTEQPGTTSEPMSTAIPMPQPQIGAKSVPLPTSRDTVVRGICTRTTTRRCQAASRKSGPPLFHTEIIILPYSTIIKQKFPMNPIEDKPLWIRSCSLGTDTGVSLGFPFHIQSPLLDSLLYIYRRTLRHLNPQNPWPYEMIPSSIYHIQAFFTRQVG